MSTRTSEDIKQHFTYLSSHLRTPSPSLISLMVSVDVKHHVYLYVQGGDPTRKFVPQAESSESAQHVMVANSINGFFARVQARSRGGR